MAYLDNLQKSLQDSLSKDGLSGALQIAGDSTPSEHFPSSLLDLGFLTLDDLKLNVDLRADQTSAFYIAIGIKPNANGTPRYWNILTTPRLSVGNFHFGFGFATFRSEQLPPPYAWWARVQGNIAIGRQLNLGISLQVPPAGDWMLQVITESGHLPTLEELTDFLCPTRSSNQSILDSLPDTLVDPSLTLLLDNLQFRFDPFGPSFGGMSVQLSQQGTWRLFDKLQVSDWQIRMDVDARKDYAVTGLLHGNLTLGSVVDMEIDLPIPADEKGWTISLKQGTSIEFPGIGELLTLIGGESVRSGLPEGMDRFGSFQMDILTICFVPSPFSIRSFRFRMRGKDDWVLWPDVLSFTDIYADLSLQKTGTGYEATGTFDGLIEVFDSRIWIQAGKKLAGDPWVFQLAVRQPIHIPGLADLAAWMLPGRLAEYIPDNFLPFGSGFDLTELDFAFDLTHHQLEKISFSIANTDAWEVIPEFMSLDDVVVSPRVSIRKVTANAEYDMSVQIGATLNLNTLSVRMDIKLVLEEKDRIFTGALTLQQIMDLRITQWADGITTSDGTSWKELTPTDMLPVEYATAYVYYNHTQERFALYGRIKDLGDAVFLTQNREYVFAFALTENFRFANLFQALKLVDSILTIRNGGIVVNSHRVASTGVLVSQIGGIVQAGDKPGSISHPIQQAHLPAGELPPGVHLYARLMFTGPLFSLFTQLHDNSDGLDVTLYAHFPMGTKEDKDSGETVFQARFEPFSMFGGLLSFKGIPADSSSSSAEGDTGVMMTYRKSVTSEFTLMGMAGVHIFGNDYEFVGNLLVNEEKTRFTVSTAPGTDITLPLFTNHLPPLFVLKDLRLDVIYYFSSESRPAKPLELDVSGKVELLDALFVNAHLYVLGGTPVLALVKLTQDFSISRLVGRLIGKNKAWPSGFFDIAFLAETENRPSRLYYYDAAKDKTTPHFTGYTDGYNLKTTVELTFLTTFNVNLEVNIVKDNGFSAEVSLNNPIRIFVLELAGKNKTGTGHGKYIGSPLLRLNTKNGQSLFGLSTGVNLFDYPFGTADITLQRKSIGSGDSEMKVGARLTADTSIPIFGSLSVQFTYCQSEGFKVTDWPDFTQAFDSVSKVIDIAAEMTSLMKKVDKKFICGAITDLITDVAYENQFTIKPSVNSSGGPLSLSLNGAFKVFVAGSQVCSIDFPQIISISLPDNASFDDWGGYIKKALADAAYSFVEGLRKNGKEWAKLSGILFMQQGAELAAQWLCQGLMDAAEAAAMAAAAEALKDLGGAAALAGGGAATAAILGKVSEKSDKAYEEAGGDDPKPDPDPEEDPDPCVPVFKEPPLLYSEHTLKALWNGARYTTGYEVEFYRPGEALLNTFTVNNQTFSVSTALAEAIAGQYKVKLRGKRGSKSSAWVETLIYKLSIPAGIELSAVNRQLIGTWGAVAGNLGYCVCLFASDALICTYTLEKGRECIELELSELSVRTGSFTITVAALGDSRVIGSDPSSPSLPVMVGQAEIPIVSIYQKKMILTGLGESPEMKLFKADGTPVTREGVIESKGNQLIVHLNLLFPRTTYRAKVQTSNTDWRETVQTIWLQPEKDYVSSSEPLTPIGTGIVYTHEAKGRYQFKVELLDETGALLETYDTGERAISSGWEKILRQFGSYAKLYSIRISYLGKSTGKPQGLFVILLRNSTEWIEINPNAGFPVLDFSFYLPKD